MIIGILILLKMPVFQMPINKVWYLSTSDFINNTSNKYSVNSNLLHVYLIQLIPNFVLVLFEILKGNLKVHRMVNSGAKFYYKSFSEKPKYGNIT